MIYVHWLPSPDPQAPNPERGRAVREAHAERVTTDWAPHVGLLDLTDLHAVAVLVRLWAGAPPPCRVTLYRGGVLSGRCGNSNYNRGGRVHSAPITCVHTVKGRVRFYL